MKVSTNKTDFGARGAGPAVENLPQTLTEPTGQCSITVHVAVLEDVGRWYDVW